MPDERPRIPQTAPPPLWAVALDKMRTYDGGMISEPVTLSPEEAHAFVQQYLATAKDAERPRPRPVGAALVQFLDYFGLTRHDTPTALEGEERDTAANIVYEEWREFSHALGNADVVKLADACADLVYTVVYTAIKAGVPFDAVFAEVHYSNLTKERGPGWPLGKCIVKGERFQSPAVAEIIEQASEVHG